MERLQARTALVFAATREPSIQAARQFANEGARLMLVDIQSDPLASLARELGARYIVADAWSASDIARCVAETEATFGGIDIAFLTVPAQLRAEGLTSLTVGTLDALWSLQLRAMLLATRAVAIAMSRRQGGSIVLALPAESAAPGKEGAARVILEHALAGVAESAARELAAQGVRVNLIIGRPESSHPRRTREERDGTPFSVVHGAYHSSAEIAALALYLAEPEHGFNGRLFCGAVG